MEDFTDEMPLASDDSWDDEDKQNKIALCLTMLASAGASTHRVEHMGSLLCWAYGFNDHQVAVLPSLITVSFFPLSHHKVSFM